MAVPSAPTDVLVTHIGQKLDNVSFRLTWTLVGASPTENYIIDEETSPGVWTQRHATGTDSGGEAVVVGGVIGVGDATRNFRIRAVNIDGASANVAFTVKDGPNPSSDGDLAEPEDVTVDEILDTEFRVTWSYPQADAGFRSHRAFLVTVESLVTGAIVDFDLPFWRDELVVGNLQPGTEYLVRVAATNDRSIGFASSTTPEPVTTAAGDPPLLAPTSITGQLGAAVGGTVRFQGDGEVIAWALSDAPAGLTLTVRAGSVQNRVADFGGTPSAVGYYTATVSARIRETSTGDESMMTVEVPIIVGGSAYLTWFHDDPERIDLQIDLRTGAVTSQILGETMQWVRGETRRVHFIFRDGSRVVATTLDFLALVVKLPGQLDSPPLLSAGGASPSTQTIAGRALPYLEVAADGTLLTSIFDALNRAGRAEPGSISLAASAQIEWRKTGGSKRTSQAFDLTFIQDNSR